MTPGAYDTMRAITLNGLTNGPCVGEGFVECISVSKSLSTKTDEDVDINISGYTRKHQQLVDMAVPKVPFGSCSMNKDAVKKLKDKEIRKLNRESSKSESPQKRKSKSGSDNRRNGKPSPSTEKKRSKKSSTV